MFSTRVLLTLLPTFGLSVNLVNQDAGHCGAGDSSTCTNIPAGVCCDSVPALGIQSVHYSGLPAGKLHGVLDYDEDSQYKCGAEQYAAIGTATSGCLHNQGYTVYGGSAWLTCQATADCYISDVPGKRSISDDTISTPANMTDLRRMRITESVKPDIFTTGGKHYFINGVIRVSLFSSKLANRLKR